MFNYVLLCSALFVDLFDSSPHGTDHVILHAYINSFPPGQNGRHFADDMFEPIFVNENVRISFTFPWNLSLRVLLIINQHWFRKGFIAYSASSNYLNQYCPSSLTDIYGTRRRWVNKSSDCFAYICNRIPHFSLIKQIWYWYPVTVYINKSPHVYSHRDYRYTIRH